VPTFLFCFAHPDDESFACAGTVMKYAERAVRSVLITATRGQRGSAGNPPLCSIEELPALREQELRDAAAIIGFDELHVLDYEDQRLAEAARAEIQSVLVGHIRRLQPAIVFTFDPDGVNRHPDHVAISRFTTDAVAAAADARFHPETGPAYSVPRVLWTPPITPWDAALHDSLDELPGCDYVIDVSQFRDRRVAALRAHRTQHMSINRCFFSRANVDGILAREVWREARGITIPVRPLDDILAGLRQTD
jgi:LmbE family N-acetylglucosaminyl deacetylase